MSCCVMDICFSHALSLIWHSLPYAFPSVPQTGDLKAGNIYMYGKEMKEAWIIMGIWRMKRLVGTYSDEDLFKKKGIKNNIAF